MRKYKFRGSEPVVVDVLRLEVQPGEVVEVEDTDVADGLDGQDVWQHIPDPVRSAAGKKAAETRADNESEGD